jgi:hypothetical protein
MSQKYHHGVGEPKASTQNEQVGGSTPNVPTHVASQGKNIAGTTKVGTTYDSCNWTTCNSMCCRHCK